MSGAYRDFSCPRCGAPRLWPCEPVKQPSKWPTILRDHEERGAAPWWLKKQGYAAYTMVDEHGTTYHLWRKPTQPPVQRPGMQLVADRAGVAS